MLSSIITSTRIATTPVYRILRQYLGEVKFTHLINAYNASRTKSFPDFTANYSPFNAFPEIYELAVLESAFDNAFNSIDAAAASRSEFDKVYATYDSIRKIGIHPSVSLLTFTQNTTSIWAALKCGEQPPRPHQLDGTQTVLVWRQGDFPRFRILGAEEAEALVLAQDGASFKAISKSLSGNNRKELGDQPAVNYLRGWLEAEFILAPENKKEILKTSVTF